MSPRDFDSDDVARQGVPLRFTENVECPLCDLVFEGVFHDAGASMTVEDMTDPPVGTHRCPDDGHTWTSEYTGWSFFSEAG